MNREYASSVPQAVEKLGDAAQQRLDNLLDRHDQGDLSAEERQELVVLVEQAEALSRNNARRLVDRRTVAKLRQPRDRAVI